MARRAAHKSLIIALVTAAILDAALLHAESARQTKLYTITGVVRDEAGLPLDHVLVTLETRDAKILEHTFTHADGRFSFTQLASGMYLLVAEKVHYHLETKVAQASEPGKAPLVLIEMPYEASAVKGQKKAPWAINTSGPMFTSTADVEPWGSWYVEPWMYNYIAPSQGTSTYYMPERLAIGLGHRFELDLWQTFESNVVGYPTAPRGEQVTAWGVGNLHGQVKYQWLGDADTYSFFARPTVTTSFDVYVPLGKYRDLDPNLYGADQFGNGTWAEGGSLIVRKRFKPFELYGQIGDLVQDPTRVGPGYTFNNGITVVPPNVYERMLDGNLLWWSGAFEHVLKSEWGMGYVLEFYGEWQNTVNPFFGRANAPPWSFLWVDPVIEFNWPNTKSLVVSWGFGVALPVMQYNYPRTFTPIGTATIYWNGGGTRGED
jgi:hypothetical protein